MTEILRLLWRGVFWAYEALPKGWRRDGYEAVSDNEDQILSGPPSSSSSVDALGSDIDQESVPDERAASLEPIQDQKTPLKKRLRYALNAIPNSAKWTFSFIVNGIELARLKPGTSSANLYLNTTFGLGLANLSLGIVRALRGERVHHTDAILEGQEILTACLLLSKDLFVESRYGVPVALVLLVARYYDPDLGSKSSFRALGHRSLAATAGFTFDPDDTTWRRIKRVIFRSMHLFANSIVAANGLRRFIIFFGGGSRMLGFIANAVVMPARTLISMNMRWRELKLKNNMRLTKIAQQRDYMLAKREGQYASLELVSMQMAYLLFSIIATITGEDEVSSNNFLYIFIPLMCFVGSISFLDAGELFDSNLGFRTVTIMEQMPQIGQTADNVVATVSALQKQVIGFTRSLFQLEDQHPLAARRAPNPSSELKKNN